MSGRAMRRFAPSIPTSRTRPRASGPGAPQPGTSSEAEARTETTTKAPRAARALFRNTTFGNTTSSVDAPATIGRHSAPAEATAALDATRLLGEPELVTDKRVIVALSATLGIAAGIALGFVIRDGPEERRTAPVASGAPDAALPDLEGVRRELEAERTSRIALEAEVDQLRWAIEQLAPDLVRQPTLEEPAKTEEEANPLDLIAKIGLEPFTQAAWFDESEFESRGYDADQIERLRTRFDSAKMEELYVKDQAAREGWPRSGQLYAEVQKIRSSLRNELGDETYDLMLYATGARNRVAVVETLATSPAEAANLQPGDVIVRYGGQNIYSVPDLKQAQRVGEAGDPVAIDVVRGGEEIRVFVPQGPLGARLQGQRRVP
jgi:hypothetical protein